MKVLILSKALTALTYRQKLVEIARLGVDVVALVPTVWREGGGGQYLESGKDEAYELIVTPLRFNGHFHLHYYPDFPKIVRQTQPDIVHIDEEPYNLATYLAARAARGRKSLFFTWQNIERRYPPPFSWMEKSVYGQVDGAIAGNADARTVLLNKGFQKDVSVIPQFGVDPQTFFPAGTQEARPFTIGFLNRLTPSKAPVLVLDALQQLPSEVRLRYVGDGPLRNELTKEIGRRGLASRVTIDPRLPSTKVPNLLRSLDVVVLPSLTTKGWKEQFGRVLIEAMASGVAVIGSDSGEIPRVIGDAGLIVREDNLEQLVEALRRVHDDSALRLELGARGRERVLGNFTHKAVAQRTVEVYHSLLDRSDRSTHRPYHE